ncbi:hypothetical protein [Janthinobacterium sp. ROICE36]|uniref:hypothetical protein n=1 Tax=Janthinobacterium sp. ROICE36 TaxID=2048670 RepID=UPI0015E0D4AC|nr:hypothetical protein [Janthinobacterium sp. ROICE36]
MLSIIGGASRRRPVYRKGSSHAALRTLTGQLTGISGTLAIRIENGQHFYGVDYSLPEP